jgi:hypothetical protein
LAVFSEDLLAPRLIPKVSREILGADEEHQISVRGEGVTIRRRIRRPARRRTLRRREHKGVEWMDGAMLMNRKQAAEALNVSLSHFQRHVQGDLPSVSTGQLRLYRSVT